MMKVTAVNNEILAICILDKVILYSKCHLLYLDCMIVKDLEVPLLPFLHWNSFAISAVSPLPFSSDCYYGMML